MTYFNSSRMGCFAMAAIAAACLAACGGGGDAAPAAAAATTSTATTSDTIASTPSPTGAPTTELVASQATTDDLQKEISAAYDNSESASLAKGVSASGKGSSGLESAQAAYSYACPGGGTLDYDIPTDTASPTGGFKAGTTYTYTYNNCKNVSTSSSYSYSSVQNGKFIIKYLRYNSSSDFAYTYVYDNLTNDYTVNGKNTKYTYSGGQSCDYKGGAYSCFYSDGKRGWSSSITYVNGVLNGVYATTYSGGTIRVTYKDYGPTGGTVTVEGANGTKTVMTRLSATSWKWEFTAKDGSKTTYSYPKA